MIMKFLKKDGFWVLLYEPDNPWVADKLESGGRITLKKTFTFSKDDIYSNKSDENEESIEFVLARLVDPYFKIEARILGTSQDFFIYKDIKLTEKFFITVKSQSVLKKIGQIVTENVYIGGGHPKSFPQNEYRRLIKEFPNSYEIEKYVQARISSVVSSYFDEASEPQSKYEKYMNKKPSIHGKILRDNFREIELDKYESILDKLKGMLKNEVLYNEKQWQTEILDIILLLYPKYILVFREAPVRDSYQNKNRQIDYLLVDANGNVGIIEIKRPSIDKIVTCRTYRDNYIPLRDLSGTVMQVEKYIFHLNKSGKAGEDKLTRKYRADIPNDFKIKITNPGGIIIMGRENSLLEDQKDDLEVIKRKYKNVIDIITYDDLIRRLENMIEVIKINNGKSYRRL